MGNKEKSLDKVIPAEKYNPATILIFEIFGPNAHFRNIQTNSTSLSHYFPPPTTVYGLIAGLCGFQRDSYYTRFHPRQTFLGIDVLTPLRKELFTVNYRVYRKGETGYTQIPVEIVFPTTAKQIRYRIYFAIQDSEFYNDLKNRLGANDFIYPPYFGTTEMLAQIEYIGEFKISQPKIGTKVVLNSIVPEDIYKSLEIFGTNLTLFPEYMRYFFSDRRIPGNMKKFFYVADGQLEATIKQDSIVYEIAQDDKSAFVCRL